MIRSMLLKSSQERRTRRIRRTSLTESLESRVLLSAVAEFVNPHPVTNDQFGASMTVLTNGNVVVMAPNDDAGGGSAAQALGQGTGGAGAVYLYNGHTGALISTLTGSSPGDFYQAKVTALTNGNFVVDTLNWNGGFGAVTWGSGTSGVSGTISAATSLVGSTTQDHIGREGVTALTNGNYVVASPNWDSGSLQQAGAATWGNGTAGIVGPVSVTNSLIGSSAFDEVGLGVCALTNGNYVVDSAHWSNGAVQGVGAATWASGTSGLTGTISASNSLVGSIAGDSVGSIVALTNGNYVVQDANWNNYAGSVTWGSGTSGVTGTISAANSLIGSTSSVGGGTGDEVGQVYPLSNGNYVVVSPLWNEVTGAATWGNGNSGVVGTISSSNSLVGSGPGDDVGAGGVYELTNGNYVVVSLDWNSQSGAATWISGTTGLTGQVSPQNSLVGSPGDLVGDGGVAVLSNGNYVVPSPLWHDSVLGEAGAATWGDGTNGVTGVVSSSNSLVGTTASDTVNGVVVLSNGNYVLESPNYSSTSAANVGAVTWENGTTATTGVVTPNNSLMGSSPGDLVGSVTPLNNGNYVVDAKLWSNGSATSAGAVTWENGMSASPGTISATNSLVGTTTNDAFGSGGLTALGTGNYLINSPNWNGDLGAVTFASGSAPTVGSFSPTTPTSVTGQLATIPAMQFPVAVDNPNNRFYVAFPTDGSGHVYRGDSLSGFLTDPTDIALSRTTIPQSLSVGSTVASLTTTDANLGATFSYSLGTSADDQAFSIVGSNLVANKTLNPDIQSTYNLDLTVTDSYGLTFTKNVTITVVDSPTALSLTSTTVKEGQPSGTTVGTFSTIESGTGHIYTYSLVSGGADNANFTISGNALQTVGAFNAATKSSYSILVQVQDEQHNTYQKSFTITVHASPTMITLSNMNVNEGLPSGTTVGTFSTTESGTGHTFTYTLLPNEVDNANFTISGNTLKTAAVFNAATKSSDLILVKVQDEKGNTLQQSFTITVFPVPSAIGLSSTTVREGQPSGTAIGTLSTTESGTGHTDKYTLFPAAGDNANFTISGNTLQTAATFNASIQSTYSVQVQVRDEHGNTFQQSFTITVLPFPNSTHLSNATVLEGLPSGTTVGTFSTAESGSGHSYTYTLVTGAVDNANFTISGNTLNTAAVLVAATKSSYSILVQVQDENNNTYQQSLTITVLRVNHAPVGTSGTMTTGVNTPYVVKSSDFGFTDPNDTPADSLLAVKFVILPNAGIFTDSGTALVAGNFVSASDINNGELIFTPKTNLIGGPYFMGMFQVEDNGGTANGGQNLDPNPKVLDIQIHTVNHAPVGTSGTLTAVENTGYIFTTADFGFTDPNDNPPNSLMAVRVTLLPNAGTVSDNGIAITAGQFVSASDISSGKLVFTPNSNLAGGPYFLCKFQVEDNGGTANGGQNLDPNPKILDVQIKNVNHAPLGATGTVTAQKNTNYVFKTSDFGFSDPNDNPPNAFLAVKINLLPGAGTLTDNGTPIAAGQFVSVSDISAGKFSFTPNGPLINGLYFLCKFQVEDNGGTAFGGQNLDPNPKVLYLRITT